MEDIDSLYAQSALFITVTAPSMHSYHWTFSA